MLICNICLEEMLLDFRELTGEHTGDNQCSIIWDTLETYGIEDRVRTKYCILHMTGGLIYL